MRFLSNCLISICAAILPPTLSAQSGPTTIPNVAEELWVSNAIFETNRTGAYENPVLARVLLESLRSDPSLSADITLKHLQHAQTQLSSLHSSAESSLGLSPQAIIDKSFDIIGAEPGLAVAAQTGRVAFDTQDAKEQTDLGGEDRILSLLSKSRNYSDIQRLQEMTWRQLYGASRTSPKLKALVTELLAQPLKADVSDDPQRIIKDSPAFADQPDVKFIRAHLKNGSLVLNAADLSNLGQADLKVIHAEFSAEKNLLRKIIDNQKDIRNAVASPTLEMERTRQANAALVKQDEGSFKLHMAGTQSGITILSSLLRLSGNSQEANILLTSGTAFIQIDTAIYNYAHLNTSISSDASELGSLVMMGNITSAALSVVQLFSSTKTPDQLILEQLKDIRNDIHDLHKDMSARFDFVDRRLNQIADDMDLRLNRVQLTLNDIQNSQQLLLQDQKVIANNISKLQFQVGETARTADHTQFVDAINNYLDDPAQSLGIPLSKEQFQLAEQAFYNYAYSHAADNNDVRIDSPTPSDSQIGVELAQGTVYDEISNFVAYLKARFPEETQSSTFPFHINFRDWSEAAVAYTELFREYPAISAPLSRVRAKRILKVGADHRSALQQLYRNNDNTVNTILVSSMVAAYRSKLQNLVAAIDAREPLAKQKINETNAAIEANAKLDLWAGSNQVSTFVPSLTEISKCPDAAAGTDISMLKPVPQKMGLIIPSEYRLAEQLGLGQSYICFKGGGYLINTRTVYTNFQGRQLPNIAGLPTYEFSLRFRGAGLADRQFDRLLVNAKGDYEQIFIPDFYLRTNWSQGTMLMEQFIKGKYWSAVTRNEGANALEIDQYRKSDREVLLAVDKLMRLTQRDFYRDAANELNTGSLQTFADELTGAKQVLTMFSIAALPTSVVDDDSLHASLFGNGAIPGGPEIYRKYADSVSPPQKKVSDAKQASSARGRNGTPAVGGTDAEDFSESIRVDLLKENVPRLERLSERLRQLLEATVANQVDQHYELIDEAIARLQGML